MHAQVIAGILEARRKPNLVPLGILKNKINIAVGAFFIFYLLIFWIGPDTMCLYLIESNVQKH